MIHTMLSYGKDSFGNDKIGPVLKESKCKGKYDVVGGYNGVDKVYGMSLGLIWMLRVLIQKEQGKVLLKNVTEPEYTSRNLFQNSLHMVTLESQKASIKFYGREDGLKRIKTITEST